MARAKYPFLPVIYVCVNNTDRRGDDHKQQGGGSQPAQQLVGLAGLSPGSETLEPDVDVVSFTA